ncbi:outer membrane beta-barrel protein [Arachidicoccus terrestris]|uniref:outer membrane beta-barrel protein n=1 Tax=Arachidicoccus terrestris TaxID=2875539 RepID=UPI001CC736A5|nr:outer membrane beta-barrel protein [Arachidicoccus terrestris]UAY56062.1 TonB-dependent receptor [Arachidicoccus terrestris]
MWNRYTNTRQQLRKKLFYLCCSAVFVFCGLTAAHAQKTDVAFKVVNKVDNKPLEKASVILIRDRDSSFLGFGITDTAGKYRFDNLKLKSGTSFVVSSLGFIPVNIPVRHTDSSLIHRFVALTPDTNLLSEVIVQSAAAVRMKGDTLEYNTEFFKTMPNAVVEELLKKLPGIEFRDKDEIYADGQRVSKITVDGKEFFSSNPKVLLKNLPADLIKKVQIVDEKNTVATETREKQDIPKVINLKLKKAVRQGILGKVFGGYGTDKRYETGGLVNLFRDTLQVSLIGTSNNQSSEGFTMQDLNEIGGFGRSGGMGGQSGYNLGGYGSSGIPKKSLAGTNINYNFTKDIQLNVQYFYKNDHIRNEFSRVIDQILGDTARHIVSNGRTEHLSKSHQIHAGFTWKQDSTGYLRYNFDWNRNIDNNFNSNISSTSTTNIDLLNTASGLDNSHSTQNNLNTNISYNKTFTKSKIDINLDGSYAHGLNAADNYVDNITTQYVKGYIPDSILRHELSHLPTTNYHFGASIHKTINKKHMVMMGASYNNDLGHSGNDVYQRLSLLDDYTYTPGQSIKFSNENGHFNSDIAYRFQDAKSRFNFKAGAKYERYNLTNTYSDASIGVQKKNYNFFSPDLSINYKTVGISFSRSMQPPSSYFLSPVTDSSSNLYFQTGNPDLSPATTSNLSFHFNKYWTKKQFSVYSNISQRWSNNNIIGKSDIDEQGITRSTFVNFGHGSNTSVNLGINKGYHKKDYNLGTGLNVFAMQNKTPLYLNAKATQTTNQNIFINIHANGSYKEIIQLNGGWNINFNNSSSEDKTYKANKNHSFTTYFNIKWKPTHRLIFQWNNRLNSQSNPNPGQRTKWYFSDASLAYSFFKKENVEFRLSAYDIFNQNKGSYQYIFQNYIYNTQDLVQKRYFMLTVSYKFKKIGN